MNGRFVFVVALFLAVLLGLGLFGVRAPQSSGSTNTANGTSKAFLLGLNQGTNRIAGSEPFRSWDFKQVHLSIQDRIGSFCQHICIVHALRESHGYRDLNSLAFCRHKLLSVGFVLKPITAKVTDGLLRPPPDGPGSTARKGPAASPETAQGHTHSRPARARNQAQTVLVLPGKRHEQRNELRKAA